MKKRSNHLGKYLLLFSSITAINIFGISYAYWNDSVKVVAKVSTGNLDVSFCENNYDIETVKSSDGDIIEIDFYKENGKDVMEIKGEVEEGYKAFIHYCVKNSGKIPVKLSNKANNINGDIKIIVNQQHGVLRSNNSFYNSNGNPKIHIEANKEGTYNYDFILNFKQWNE